MKKKLADFISDAFGVATIVNEKKAIVFETEQPAQLRAALSNIIDACKDFESIVEVRKGGKRFVLRLRSDSADDWTVTKQEFDLANDAIIAAATLSKDPANGMVQVYDAFRTQEVMLFPTGGIS